MPHQAKIATCSYCLKRQVLRPLARDGHELACSSCGAPLHEMKWLKPPQPERQKKRSRKQAAPHGAPLPRHEDLDQEAGRRRGKRPYRDDDDDRYKRKRKKRRTPLWKKAVEEAFDVIEDIFD